MEQQPDSNLDFSDADVFTTVNPYFLLLFSFICIVTSGIIQSLFALSPYFRIGITVAPIAALVLPFYLLTRRFRGGFRGQAGLDAIQPRLLLYTLLASLAMVVVVDYLFVFAQQFSPLPDEYMDAVEELRPDGLWEVFVTYVGLGIVVPFAEELVFRGVIQRVLAYNMNGWVAVILAGVFFGAIHLNPPLLLSLAVFGVYVGFLFHVTRNLMYAIVAHALLNTVAFVQIATSSSEETSEIPFYATDWQALIAATFLVVFICWRIKKETSAAADVLHENHSDWR